jgi:hypothetical protein
MIVTSRPPRRERPKAPAQPAEITAPRIVQHFPKQKRQRQQVEITPDVWDFFGRMGLKVPED